MMDLVFIVIFGHEYTMLSERFRTNNCSQLLDVIRTFSLLDLAISLRSRRGLIAKACQYQVYCRLTLLWPAEYNSRSSWMLQKRAAPCLVLKRCTIRNCDRSSNCCTTRAPILSSAAMTTTTNALRRRIHYAGSIRCAASEHLSL